MRKRNKILFAVFFVLLLASLGACSNSKDESETAATNSSGEENGEAKETETEGDDSEQSKNSNTDEEQKSDMSNNEDVTNSVASGSNEGSSTHNSDNNSDKDENQDQNTYTEDDPSAKEDSDEGSQENSTDESGDREEDFDLQSYLKSNYVLDGVHYETDSWQNEDTGKTEYIVNILPNTKEYSNEINEVFHDSNVAIYEDERTDTMSNTADKIIRDLPEVNNKLHIEAVNWVSYDGDFSVTLVQDR